MTLDRKALLKRLAACIVGGLVLALMVGDQEGSQNDFGVSFRLALHNLRWLLFVGVGLVLFVVITFWPVVARYLRRPGAIGVGAGFILLVAAMVLMNWYSPVGKFSAIADKVSQTSGLDFLPDNFFGWLGWTLWILNLAAGAAAVILVRTVMGWIAAALGVVSAVIAYVAHDQLATFAGGNDHALGVYVATLGYLVFAGAGVVTARTASDEANPRAFVEAVMTWRPGFPLAVVATVLALIGLFNASWFAPLVPSVNLDFRGLSSPFSGTGLNQLASAYINWLGWVLTIVALIAAFAATYLRHRLLGYVTAAIGVVGAVLTVFTLHALSSTGAEQAPNDGKLWQNLGSGGWVLCIVFSLVAAAGVLAANLRRKSKTEKAAAAQGIKALPIHKAADVAMGSGLSRSLIAVAVILALFYPPTLTGEWQNTIVTQIGPYLLLAVGLNVVVGWAGLLDLGYIAFYAVGAYTTGYITGSLPIKPPSFLHLSPLWAIPFAIIAALIAGVLLGGPTLRLRGDYLAIVTLGFGEIIQQVAINNPGGFTGGSTGPNVPHPTFKLGPLQIHWGLDNLPYWYLLLIFLVVVVILFYRLEGSRLGRAWAAIREDEVAAQATGVDTTKVKLLAFAIGASTSGLAGVFFATQVGYFDPSLFTLQNSILIVAYVVFGGMGSLQGALAGAAVLTWLPIFLKDQVPQQDRQMWIGALVLLMMIFRPAGLIPARRRKAELEGLEAPSSSEVSAVPVSEGL